MKTLHKCIGPLFLLGILVMILSCSIEVQLGSDGDTEEEKAWVTAAFAQENWVPEADSPIALLDESLWAMYHPDMGRMLLHFQMANKGKWSGISEEVFYHLYTKQSRGFALNFGLFMEAAALDRFVRWAQDRAIERVMEEEPEVSLLDELGSIMPWIERHDTDDRVLKELIGLSYALQGMGLDTLNLKMPFMSRDAEAAILSMREPWEEICFELLDDLRREGKF